MQTIVAKQGNTMWSRDDFLRKAREAVGLSQHELALKINYRSRESVNWWENGGRRPQLDIVPLLADILGLDREKLCKKALFDESPLLFRALYGRQDTQKNMAASDPEYGTRKGRLIDAFSSCPPTVQDQLISLAHSLAGIPVKHGA